MKVLQRRDLLWGVGIALLAVLLSFVFPGPFEMMENGALYARYNFRGESSVDSSVLIVYFNEDEIRTLGGMPLRRSYYALLISALNDLGASAIGVDVVFPQPNAEYPEYDEVLASVAKKADNIVLGGYFKTLVPHASEMGNDENTEADTALLQFSYKQNAGSDFFEGIDFVVPFPKLYAETRYLGHANFDGDYQIPLFAKYGSFLFPSLSFELFRLSEGVKKDAITITPHTVTLGRSEGTISIPLKEQGLFSLNYPGGLGSLHTLPALQLLKAYDAANRGERSSFPLEILRGKIVLLGVIAEGLSSFMPTPFTSQFPAIGIHAVALSNMLQRKFLKDTPEGIEFFIALVLGFLAVAGTSARREVLGIVLIFVALPVYLLSCFVFFSVFDFVLPMVRPLFALLSTTTVLLFIKYQAIRRGLANLEQEKENLTARLQEKERHLQMLEHELSESKEHRDQSTRTTLLEEIEKYKREVQRLTSQVSDLRAYELPSGQVGGGTQFFEGIVYRADGPIAGIVEFIKKIAANDAPVLILGESGTGKELVARAIHRQSHRKDRPFVALNCGALSETLLESEIFGHEKGAFTGAVREKPGRFDLANGGTMFLDEIGETSDAFQVKLLRVLQEGEFERVGGTVTRKVNVRILAATNKDLKSAVAGKEFREDVYYRLNTLTIQLPPLRDRVDDIPALVEHCISVEHQGMRVSANVMETFRKYMWKGNVRELQGAVKRAVILARSDHRDILRLKDLPDEVLEVAREEFDFEEQILESLRGRKFSHSAISETAEELGGLNRGTVAEYFRGSCFKMFCENGFDIGATVNAISQDDEGTVRAKVEKKLVEYLSNAVEFARNKESLEEVLIASRPKFKNLPQRYHSNLEEILQSFHRGDWNLDGIA